jgi:acid phosphatase (class A)
MKSFKTILACALLSAGVSTVAIAQTAPATMAKPAKTLKMLADGDVVPSQILAAPPARGSATEAMELDNLRRLIAGVSAARMEQARWDDVHEDPAIFDAAMGPGVSLKALPATGELLVLVNNDAGIVTNVAKKQFDRMRPWGVDRALPNCDAGRGKQPVGSYPSGHATLGYSVGPVLAMLVPEKAEAIMARAKDYALSREYCGVHFASDTAASQVVGAVVATRIMTSAKAQEKIAAARAELRAAKLTIQ